MPLRLTVFAPDRPGTPTILQEGRDYQIGRTPPADVVIDDVRVSRTHAVLRDRDGHWRIQDLCSKNGIRLDGMPVAGAVLHGRRWLSIGGVPAVAEPTSAPPVGADLPAQAARRMFAAAADTPDPEAMVTRTLEALRSVADCERVGVWIAADDGTPRLLRSIGSDDPLPSIGTIRAVLATRRPVFCSDTEGAAALARSESIAAGAIRALVVVPVGLEAVIYLDSRRPGKLFTQEDAQLIEGFAEQLSLILAAADLQAALTRVAT